MRKVLAGLGLLAAIVTAGAARADAVDDALAGKYEIVPCRTHDQTQEKADNELALTALQLLNKGDIASAQALMPQLRAAQGRSPDVAPKAERCGDTINIYSDSTTDLLVVTGLLGNIPDAGKVSVTLKGAPPYGPISFVIGWIEYEHKDFEAALKDYNRAKLNEPDSLALASEISSTLSMLGRAQESYDAAAAFLAAHPGLSDKDKATLLRREGYALIDLNRLDDAEAAYNQSLKLDPGNATALGDLDYIRQQRASH